jgi:hypothetical protein
MTLREFQRNSPSVISIEELALINQVEPDTVLQPGQLGQAGHRRVGLRRNPLPGLSAGCIRREVDG